MSIDKTKNNEVSSSKKNKLQLNGYEIGSSPVTRPNISISVEDSMYVIYTSGSTGKPKGCVISHKNVVRLMKNDKHDFDFSSKSRVSS